LRKLGLITSEHVETLDFDRYLNLFKEGLTEEKVGMIKELFMERSLTSEEGVDIEDTE
jgi:hypothetical protein